MPSIAAFHRTEKCRQKHNSAYSAPLRINKYIVSGLFDNKDIRCYTVIRIGQPCIDKLSNEVGMAKREFFEKRQSNEDR
jgi:hypothetical protein